MSQLLNTADRVTEFPLVLFWGQTSGVQELLLICAQASLLMGLRGSDGVLRIELW